MDFITEKKVISVLLEGNCTASDSFIDKLKSIKDNQIAFELLDIFINQKYTKVNLPQNYIDVTDKDNMVSFLGDVKADRLKDFDDFDDSDLFFVKGRGEIAIGRMARAILSNKDLYNGKSFSDKDYEQFVNLYKSKLVTIGNKFKVITGKDISDYYSEDNYSSYGDGGSLWSSCMRGDDCQKFFNIYIKNPDVCSLLVYLDKDDKVLGRALVWKLSKSVSESNIFMDRVYTIKDSDVNKFIEYANERKWMYKYKQTSQDAYNIAFKFQGGLYVGKITVQLDKSEFKDYPYLDTLYNLNFKKKTISNVPTKNTVFLDETEGDYATCYDCGGSHFNNEECDKCYGNGSVDCNMCSGRGMVDCDECGGSGKGDNLIECDKCDGSGKNGFIKKSPCTKCSGKGNIYDECKVCDGDGEVDCGVCGGSGSIDCDECGGDGNVDNPCPSCVGFYKNSLEFLSNHCKDLSNIAKLVLEDFNKKLKEK